MNLNYTTKKQSKTLFELGLPEDSADMYYGYRKSKPDVLPYEDAEVKALCLPCWSTGALIKLLPKSVDYKNMHYTLIFDVDRVCYLGDWWNSGYNKTAFASYTYDKKNKDSLTNALYEAVVWLLENNLLKNKI